MKSLAVAAKGRRVPTTLFDPLDDPDRWVVIGLRLLLWRQTMKIKYDPQVDAAYISFKKGPTQVTTVRFTEDVAIDLGQNEEIVGMESWMRPNIWALIRASPR